MYRSGSSDKRIGELDPPGALVLEEPFATPDTPLGHLVGGHDLEVHAMPSNGSVLHQARPAYAADEVVGFDAPIADEFHALVTPPHS